VRPPGAEFSSTVPELPTTLDLLQGTRPIGLKATNNIRMRVPKKFKLVDTTTLLDTGSTENLMAYHVFPRLSGAKLELSNFGLQTVSGLIYPYGVVEIEFRFLKGGGRTPRSSGWWTTLLMAQSLANNLSRLTTSYVC